MTLTYTSELMQNYVQGEIVSPTGKFEALQTGDGHSLLFATDTSGVLRVIEEGSGQTRTGWTQTDLSSSVVASNFAGKSDAVVRTFDAGQSAVDGTIGLAMAITSGGNDHLFASLGNLGSDTSWIGAPTWTSYPFDAPGTQPSTIAITGILFAESGQNQQFIIVDIDRAPGAAVKDIARYYVDPTKAQGTCWVEHDMPIDVEDDSYQSCVGQIAGGYVDGVYTAGTAAGSAQLVYVPVVNAFGDGPPLTTRLNLPGGALATAIAVARNTDLNSPLAGTTDLYAVGQSTLYRFAADGQNDGATGQAIATNAIIAGTVKLMAMTHDGVTTLWGQNGSDQVYYLSCTTDQLANPGGWGLPVPILGGVERCSAYVNRTDGGNTIFASGGGNLQKVSQATGTTGKLWYPQAVTLATPPNEKSLSFNSYTTTLRATDANNLPAANVNLAISAKSRSPVYMNGLYYILGPTPVNVATDSFGSVTVIETTPTLNGTVLSVSIAGAPAITANPMDRQFNKLAALNTPDKLRAATIDNGRGGTVPLVSPSAGGNDVQAVADNMSHLSTVYQSVQPAAAAAPQVRAAAAKPTRALAASPQDDVAIAFGDLASWLRTGVDAVITVVKDAAGEVWHFVAEIAGKVYRAVLDTAEAVVGAVEWVFDAIKTAVEDLIHYLEFLFEWDDIRRTKDVFHTMLGRYLRDEVADVEKIRAAFDGHVAEVEKSVNQWGGITDWTLLGDPAGKPSNGSTSNPAQGQTSGSQLFAHHFQNHAADLVMTTAAPALDLVGSLVDDLLTALSNEGKVLSGVYDQLKDLSNQFHSLSVQDVIKRIAGILADGVLSSAQVVIDALLDVLSSLANAALDALDTKIHIPVISDILAGIGIPELSFLDLFTWIAAVGYTVAYKIANGAAPFQDDADTQRLIAAPDWDSLLAMFHPPTVSLSAAVVTVPTAFQSAIFVSGHGIASFVAMVSDFINTFEANQPNGNEFGIPSAVLGIISGAASGVADALVPKYPIESKPVSDFLSATTLLVILSKLVFSGPAQTRFAATTTAFSGLAVGDGRATGAIVNSVLVIPALFGNCWHFYELSSKPACADRSAAIIGEVSNLANHVSRISYAVAVNDKDPETKEIAIGIMAGANIVVAGLQMAEAIID